MVQVGAVFAYEAVSGRLEGVSPELAFYLGFEMAHTLLWLDSGAPRPRKITVENKERVRSHAAKRGINLRFDELGPNELVARRTDRKVVGNG